MELNSKKSNWADLYILYYKLPLEDTEARRKLTG